MEAAGLRAENGREKQEIPSEDREETKEQAGAIAVSRSKGKNMSMDSPNMIVQDEDAMGGSSNDLSSSMKDQAGAPPAVSAALTDVHGLDHGRPAANTPRQQYLPRHAASLDDDGKHRPRDVLSSSNDAIKVPGVHQDLVGYDVVDAARSTKNELPERPASNPAGTRNPGTNEVIPKASLPTEQEPPWTDCATQTVIGPTTLKAGSGRPTSVPNFHSHSNFHPKPASRGRRDEAPHSSSSDQSFVAGHTHRHPTLRTRSSQASHSPSYSSDSSAIPRDFADMPLFGAKTAGNTPSQSPGLFSPTIPGSSPFTQDPDDPAARSQSLHPAHNLHLRDPIETHNLNKAVDPESGRKTINEYELDYKLGSGQHGTVKLGRNLNTGQVVGIKIVRRFTKRLRLLRHGDPSDIVKKEVAILKKARHPHVVSLLEVIDDEQYQKIYLVLEYVERGEIVWRKDTDRHVANFEMKRVKRELAGMRDESFELEEVERFNQSAPARRAEKLRLQLSQPDRTKGRVDENTTPLYWSSEHLELGEQDRFGEGSAGSIDVPERTSFRLSDTSLNPEDSGISPQGSTPKQHDTPKPIPLDAMALETVTPESLSRPESTKEMSDLSLPAGMTPSLEGTMYGPYVPEAPHRGESLSWNLHDTMDLQTQWTMEEKQYHQVPCLTIYQIQKAFRQTVIGLEYLHFQGIIHRDIKPANLLWTEGFDVKISDFGVSYLGKAALPLERNEDLSEANADDINEAVELAKTVGTPAFYAPEMCDPDLFDLEKNPVRPRISGQVDVWALGVTLYCMVFGRLPFVAASEMAMYEKIASEEVFIPRVRLRGAEHSDKDPETNDKRMDDIIEYEPVDDELHDLIKHLLQKKPSERISIKEIKHHPWVLRGINDLTAWVDETDPSVQSQGKKIEISNDDVAGAIQPYTFVDRVRAGLRRIGSLARRDARKRTDSNVKSPDSPSSTIPKGNGSAQEGRRASLRGDEQIFTALRASREGSEHPLSQSLTASPEIKTSSSYFDAGNGSPAGSSSNSPRPGRPTMSERTLSSAESAKTVRAAIPAIQETILSPGEPFSSLTTPIDSSSSSLGGIFHGAGRRFVNSMRSRERGRGRDSPSRSSRSSSADTNLSNIEDPHASPSLAISSEVAAGRVDQPPVLREEPSSADLRRAAPTSSPSPSQARTDVTNEAFQQAQEQNFRRQIIESTEVGPTGAEVASAASQPCPASPDDDLFFARQHRAPPRVSSSSDQMASGTISESFSHPSVPSVVSGASSFSAANEGDNILRLSKEVSPSTLVPTEASESSNHGGVNAGHRPELAKAHTADDDEAGYNGEGEMDSDSDDDLLMMGPKK